MAKSEKIPGFVLHKRALQLRDKIACVHLMWTGDVFGNTMVCVDLVPAFALPPSFEPATELPLPTANQPCHIVAKKSRHSSSRQREDFLFSYSYALHENECMIQLPAELRQGYTLAKALRIAAISKPTDIDGLVLDMEKEYNNEDIITSYMLKTCLFTVYKEHAETNNLYGTVRAWTERVYKRLHKAVRHRKLPTYYGDGVLFQCKESTDDKNVCCQDRLLIMRMCDAILNWLQANKTEVDLMLQNTAGYCPAESRRRRLPDPVRMLDTFVHQQHDFYRETSV